MKQNSVSSQNKEKPYQDKKQIDSAIQISCQHYQEHRDKAEKQISQGAQMTKHQIKL